jgi:predicted transcriptional regulator
MGRKNYFIFDNDFLFSLSEKLARELSLTEAVIISFISSWGENGYYGSQKTMAKKLHITDRTLRNHLRKLIKEEVILEKKNQGYDTKCLIFNKNFENQTIYNSEEEDKEFQELLNSLKLNNK